MKGKTIRVVHVVGSFHFGGIERLVYDLISAQKKTPYVCPEVLVLKNKGEFKPLFEELGVNLTALDIKSAYSIKPNSFKLMLRTFKSAEIIHLHGFHPISVILSLLTGKKIVYTEHGNFAFGRKVKLSDKVNHFLRRLFFKYSADLVACNSKFTKNYINKVWGIDKPSIRVVYNGSDINPSVNRKEVATIKNTYANKFIIGITTRLAGFKKVFRLINAFKNFSINKNDVCLIIVGDGPERRSLETSAGKYLNQTIFFTGFKANPYDYQKAFNVCVYPSANEPFGLVAVEAMSVGTPVIVFSDGGGLTEIVTLSNPDDVVENIDGLVKRLEYYYFNRGIKQDTTEVLGYFTAERMAKDYLIHYQKLLCAE